MTPTIYKYNEINIGKYKSVRHFELVDVDGSQILTNLLNISQDRQFAKSHPDFWLKTHNGKKWSNPITGLFKTRVDGNVYFGDLEHKKHLILVSLGDTMKSSKIVVYVYQNWYPFHKNEHPKVTASKIIEFNGIKNDPSGV
jgi:hypothetical protein